MKTLIFSKLHCLLLDTFYQGRKNVNRKSTYLFSTKRSVTANKLLHKCFRQLRTPFCDRFSILINDEVQGTHSEAHLNDLTYLEKRIKHHLTKLVMTSVFLKRKPCSWESCSVIYFHWLQTSKMNGVYSIIKLFNIQFDKINAVGLHLVFLRMVMFVFAEMTLS